MPVAGLPTAVETSLNALLSENFISSWKIVGEGDTTVFVLRLKPQLSKTTTNMAPPLPIHYRKKPPSQIKRDNDRAKQRQDQRDKQLQEKASDLSDSAETLQIPSLFLSPMFQDTQQCVDRPTTTELTSCIKGTESTAVVSSASEDVLGTCTAELSTEGGAVGYDFSLCDQIGLPFESLPLPDPCEKKAIDLGYDTNVVKNYVSTLMDPSVQRRLRNENRNKNFRKVALDIRRGQKLLLFESDDIVLEHTFTHDDSRSHTSFWYVKQRRQHMLMEEDEKQQTLSTLNHVGYNCYLDARAEAQRELHILRDLMCYYLG